MFKLITISLLLTCLNYSVEAQQIKMAGKRPSVEELKKKYPGVEAVLLNASQHYRIKLKDGEPYVESTQVQQMLYLSVNAAAYLSQYGFEHSGFHELREYQAYTRTADNKRVNVTDFKTASSKSSSVFYDDAKETRFDFPGITPGATGNLELSVIHKNPHLLSPYYFARSIPVINNELKISFSKEISVKYVLKGNDREKIEFSEETKRGEITYTFHVRNLDPEKKYADAPDNSYYSPHVIFYIEKFETEKGKPVNYLSNIDDLYKFNAGFVKFINKEVGPGLKHVVDSLTANISSTEEKARRIYSWVQSNIKYVAFEEGMEGFIPRDANLVCSRRFGDCKDMSSILTLMLNTAGIKAYYTWIGTRDLPYSYSEIPLPIVDNHMICTIRLNDEYIFLDGTDPTCVFGTPSQGIQDKEALIAINPVEYKIVRVPMPAKENNMVTDSTFLQLTDKGITGRILIHMTGYFAMDMNDLFYYTNERNREKYLKNEFSRGSNKFRLDKYEIGDRRDKNNLTLSAQFQLDAYAKKIGNEWYINLNLFKHYEHEEIDYPERKIPVQLNSAFVKKYVTILTIPEGYHVSTLPKNKSFSNDLWGFDITYHQTGKTVILTEEFHNDHLFIMPDNFQAWNEVLKNLLPQYKETIGLSKN